MKHTQPKLHLSGVLASVMIGIILAIIAGRLMD